MNEKNKYNLTQLIDLFASMPPYCYPGGYLIFNNDTNAVMKTIVDADDILLYNEEENTFASFPLVINESVKPNQVRFCSSVNKKENYNINLRA